MQLINLRVYLEKELQFYFSLESLTVFFRIAKKKYQYNI